MGYFVQGGTKWHGMFCLGMFSPAPNLFWFRFNRVQLCFRHMWYVYNSFITCFYPVGFVYQIDLLASPKRSELFVSYTLEYNLFGLCVGSLFCDNST